MPTSLRERLCNPGKRPLNKREPKPRKDTPRCPVWLCPKAKKFWKQIVPELRTMGVLTVVDGPALANLCQLWARWRDAEEFITEHGTCYPLRDARGSIRYMQQFPQVSIARNLSQQLKGMYQEFGLTPSARARLDVEIPGSSVDEFDRFRYERDPLGD